MARIAAYATLLCIPLQCLLPPMLNAQSSLAQSPPNILLIMTDDQGWPTLGCYGGELVATPHLDRLAAEGVRFTDAYVTSQCTPTRATLLTGQYTARHGLWHVLGWYGYPWARMTEPMFAENFPRDTFTVAKGLRDAGYETAIVGKWHLTSNSDGHYMGLKPEAAHHYGFDFAPPILSKDEFAEGGDRGVETLTSQAIEFIEQNRDRPWFCYLSHHMIHGVVVAPDDISDKYRRRGFGDEGPNRAVYLAGLECIDRSLGRLMNRLKELGEEDQTLIIFLSDNGGVHERLDFKSIGDDESPRLQPDLVEYDNAPLRAGKGSTYEGGTRIPMIARWPSQIPAGTVIDTPVHAVDILPTCFEVAEATTPDDHTLDGRSLVELMTAGSDESLRERPLYQYYPFYDLRWGLTPNASVRVGDYKLIEFFGDRFDRRHQYIAEPTIELYNLRTDIGESRNLVTSEPERARQQRQRLHRWMESINANVPAQNRHYDPAKSFRETRDKPAWLRSLRWKPSVADTD